MRPPEAKNLRWRDIMPAKDRDGKEIVVLFVEGKGKSRKLVAAPLREMEWRTILPFTNHQVVIY